MSAVQIPSRVAFGLAALACAQLALDGRWPGPPQGDAQLRAAGSKLPGLGWADQVLARAALAAFVADVDREPARAGGGLRDFLLAWRRDDAA